MFSCFGFSKRTPETNPLSRLATKASTAHVVVQTAATITAMDVDSLATQAGQLCISSRDARAVEREAALAQRKQERDARLAAKSAEREAAAELRKQEREAKKAERDARLAHSKAEREARKPR